MIKMKTLVSSLFHLIRDGALLLALARIGKNVEKRKSTEIWKELKQKIDNLI